MQLAAIIKAIIAALVAFLSALATGLGDGSLTAQEWIYAAIGGLVALGAVYGVPNKVPPA